MMLATIEALKNIGGSASLDELDEKVVELNGVSEEEQQVTMPSDPRPKLNYYLAWTRTYLKRGEAIRNSSRGVWALTEVGRKINKVSECKAIYDRVQAEERDRQRKKRLAKKAAEPELNLSPEPEDVMEPRELIGS
jgi:restriction system protein